ncbi:hypothetical protein SAMN02910456_00534 [Ruminococcaceae bacterium YRB3002]|nr:hypothetical protein SAMN02910456_00534 [Ruminococcaceae bacterium YRB3002]
MKEIFGVPRIVTEARELASSNAKGGKPGLHWILTILVTLAILISAEILAEVPVFIWRLTIMFARKRGMSIDAPSNMLIMTVRLYSFIIITAVFILYTKLIEKRPARTLGFVKKGFVIQYLIGIVVGFGIFSLAILICKLTGAIDITLNSEINAGSIILILGGWLIQGMEEEVCCRGFMLTSLSRRYSVAFGVIANAVLFAALHLLNDGISVLAFINLVLFGLFASVMFVRTGNIWMCSAVHSIWNFVQGNFYGISVSGNELLDSVFRTSFNSSMTIWNGGDFGLEGGLGVTIVLVLGTVILMFIPCKDTGLAEIKTVEAE